MTEEQNKLAEEIERILAEYHRAVELDDASLLPKIMSQWCDLFFKPGASAILAGLREPATEAVLRELVIEAREEFRHHSPEMDSWLVRADAALKGKGASQGASFQSGDEKVTWTPDDVARLDKALTKAFPPDEQKG